MTELQPKSAAAVMAQNNGDVTRAYYDALMRCGPMGEIGVALFRAQKRSRRAKEYRRGKYRRAAYDVKEWSLGEVCRLLEKHGDLGFAWGWKQDPTVLFDGEPSWVLYVDLPRFGQVSFHAPSRGEGPDYPGEWDGQRASAERIIQFCDWASEYSKEAV